MDLMELKQKAWCGPTIENMNSTRYPQKHLANAGSLPPYLALVHYKYEEFCSQIHSTISLDCSCSDTSTWNPKQITMLFLIRSALHKFHDVNNEDIRVDNGRVIWSSLPTIILQPK